MSTKLIVVTGVTGVQGGSVARLFAQDPNWRVRGITRHSDKPANASLREAGIELVAGDYDDVDSLDRAFNGANAIFGTTDFWYEAETVLLYASKITDSFILNTGSSSKTHR